LSSYFQNINQDSNYKRFLASLSKFFQFALDQHLISSNPFPKALKAEPEIDLEDVIKQYQQQLETKKFSLSTIRNYINDVHQFINWAQNESRPVKGDVTT
jgi:site-specific recombinase XerD